MRIRHTSFPLLSLLSAIGHSFQADPLLTFESKVAIELIGGNVSAIEGGTVISTREGYALFTTDISSGSDVDTRIVYFTSTSRDGPFAFANQLICCSSGVTDGRDNRASLWAPMPSFNGTHWHLFYVQYASAASNASGWYDNFHGEIGHAVSSDGIGGPYQDKGVVLSPDSASQPWEGLQGTDSISPPFRLPNGSFAAFYGSSHTEIPAPAPFQNPHGWNNGLVIVDQIGEPFRRVTPSSLVNLNGGGSENPVVTYLPHRGIYFAVFDDLYAEGSGFGLSRSVDGLVWSSAELVPVPGGVRTPLGVVLEEDGSVSLYYTTGHPERPWRARMRLSSSTVVV